MNFNRVTLQHNNEFITKYSSDRFLSICGEKRYCESLLKSCKLISNLTLCQIIDSNLTNVHKLAA